MRFNKLGQRFGHPVETHPSPFSRVYKYAEGSRTRPLMKIDLEYLTYNELVALNHKIVERLTLLDALHTHREM